MIKDANTLHIKIISAIMVTEILFTEQHFLGKLKKYDEISFFTNESETQRQSLDWNDTISGCFFPYP